MEVFWLLVLRLIHVVGGIVWVGGLVALAWFVVPTQRLEGADGGRFVSRMMVERHFTPFLITVALSTLLSGFALYGRAMIATAGQWGGSRPAIVYGFGAISAVTALIVGVSMGGVSEKKMAAIGQRLSAERRPPTTEETAQLEALAARAGRGARIASILLLVTAVAMSVARYA